MADNLLFRKGTYAQLQTANKIVGAIDFTTDEPAIYLNVETENGGVERKRIGDIIQFNTLNEFKTYADERKGNLPKTALYYIIDTNSLLKWVDGTKTEDERWQQINVNYNEEIGALQGEVGTLSLGIENINSRLDIIDDLIGSGSGEEGGSTGAIVDRISDAEEAVENLQNEFNTAKTDIDKIPTLEQQIEGLQGTVDDKADKTELGKLSEDLTAEKEKVQKNIDDIADINEAIQGIGENITGLNGTLESLQGNVGTNAENIAKNKEDIEKALSDAQSALNEAIDGVAEDVSGLTTKVDGIVDTQLPAINQAIEALQGDVGNFEEALEGLGTDLRQEITNEINAANAMNFIGAITASGDLAHATLPEGTNLKAGDTYVATNTIKGINGIDFVDNQTAYAGDLIIASGEEENGYIKAETLEWNVVNTGYQEAHDQRLEVNDNKVNLMSDISNSTSSVAFKGAENSNIVVEQVEGENTLTFKMVWGSFGSN